MGDFKIIYRKCRQKETNRRRRTIRLKRRNLKMRRPLPLRPMRKRSPKLRRKRSKKSTQSP